MVMVLSIVCRIFWNLFSLSYFSNPGSIVGFTKAGRAPYFPHSKLSNTGPCLIIEYHPAGNQM